MKKIGKRLTAAVCAVWMMSAAMLSSASAAEESTEKTVKLPSGETMQTFQHRMTELITMSPDDFASASFGIFCGDEVLETQYLGYTNIEEKIPASAESVYEWGSISKTFIWVSALQLWEQGKLDLERDIREYLPDGFFRHLSYDAPITMMHLMNHNAGWQETTYPLEKTKEDEILSLREELQALEPAQIHRPGEVVAYSNYGAGVAGYVIECVSGMDYCTYVRRNIFEPLGMEHTALSPTHSDNAFVKQQLGQLKSYECQYGSLIDLGYCDAYIPAYPAGAAAGTLQDLMTYAQAFVDDDAPLFRNPETQKRLFTATTVFGTSDIPCCAHGFFCTEYAVRTYGHSGATNTCQSNMIFDLESKTGLVILVNEPRGNRFLEAVPMYVFGELSPERYASADAKPITVDGYYLISRSTHRGMFKFISYLTAVNLDMMGTIKDLGNEVWQLEMPGVLDQNKDMVVIVGSNTKADGTHSVMQPSVELLRDPFYLWKLLLLTGYILLGVISVFMLLIRRKLKKADHWKIYAGSGYMTAAQVIRLISVLLLLSLYMFYSMGHGGVRTSGVVIGIGQMVCGAACCVLTVLSLLSLRTKQEKDRLFRYLFSAGSNLVCVGAILYFEMYRFWGC